VKVIFLSLIAYFIGTGACAVAQGNDPNFTYVSADQAFASGTAPAEADLTQKWMMIGIATSYNLTPTWDGYWPDGKIQFSGYPGYFQKILTFSETTDTFGHMIYSWMMQLIGYESRKIYNTEGPVPGMITPSGYVVDFIGDAPTCAVHSECRLVTSENGKVLLCADSGVDQRSTCSYSVNPDKKKPSYYAGFVILQSGSGPTQSMENL